MKCQQIPAEKDSTWEYIKTDFSKLQMRYVDGHKVGVHGTKKLGVGMRLTVQQKRNERHENSEKMEILRKNI